MARRFALPSSTLAGKTFQEQFPELSGERAAFGAFVANRAAMYGGVGRAEWFRGRESSDSAARGQAQTARAGVVVHYVSIDDRGTCRPCHDAERAGPYLEGEGPFPGEVCRGRGRCRCRRETRRNAEAYRRLTTGAAGVPALIPG